MMDCGEENSCTKYPNGRILSMAEMKDRGKIFVSSRTRPDV